MTKVESIVRDFKRGLTVIGLARKYGKTKLQIEAIIRSRFAATATGNAYIRLSSVVGEPWIKNAY